jgi:hypothetical protein
MAKFELRLLCNSGTGDYTTVNRDKDEIVVTTFVNDQCFNILFDKSTAIKFAKTLRTEINKIQ